MVPTRARGCQIRGCLGFGILCQGFSPAAFLKIRSNLPGFGRIQGPHRGISPQQVSDRAEGLERETDTGNAGNHSALRIGQTRGIAIGIVGCACFGDGLGFGDFVKKVVLPPSSWCGLVISTSTFTSFCWLASASPMSSLRRKSAPAPALGSVRAAVIFPPTRRHPEGPNFFPARVSFQH